jgi:hypothetical protein
MKTIITLAFGLFVFNTMSAQESTPAAETETSPKYILSVGTNFINNDGTILPFDRFPTFDWQYAFNYVSLERTLKNKWSVEVVGSVNRFDLTKTKNSSYFSGDANAKYNFGKHFIKSNKFDMYAFAGGGLFAVEREIYPAVNAGGGLRYWFTDHIGINYQGYGKVTADETIGSFYQHVFMVNIMID